RAAAIGAALFMGLALYPVQNASFFVPGVPAAFGVTCTLYLAECLRRDPSRRRYLFAAVSLATATSLWYPAGVVALALCIAHIDGVVATTPPGRARRRALIDHRVRLAIGVTALLLIVFFPPLLIHPGEILAKIANEFFQAGRAAPSDRWAWTSWLALGLKHVELLSPGLVLLAGIAIAWNVCAWRRRELLWWLPVLCCWLLLVNLLRTRHLLVLVPFYALWVGRWLQAVSSARLRSLRVVGYGGCAVVAVLAFGTNLRIFWMRYMIRGPRPPRGSPRRSPPAPRLG
ncbi:MAG: hypothetical protein HY543_06000, partial [Deltaproteobacteria bacterium]|nr:hypothetical protein [Deltaproteobacteria bacterium]